MGLLEVLAVAGVIVGPGLWHRHRVKSRWKKFLAIVEELDSYLTNGDLPRAEEAYKRLQRYDSETYSWFDNFDYDDAQRMRAGWQEVRRSVLPEIERQLNALRPQDAKQKRLYDTHEGLDGACHAQGACPMCGENISVTAPPSGFYAPCPKCGGNIYVGP